MQPDGGRDTVLFYAAKGWRPSTRYVSTSTSVDATRVGPAEPLKAKVSPNVPGRESLSLMNDGAIDQRGC